MGSVGSVGIRDITRGRVRLPRPTTLRPEVAPKTNLDLGTTVNIEKITVVVETVGKGRAGGNTLVTLPSKEHLNPTKFVKHHRSRDHRKRKHL